MQKSKLNIKNKISIKDDENLPVQFYPVVKSKKKKSEKVKIETM